MSDTDADLLHRWTGHLFDRPEHLPVSFLYGGEQVRGIPAGWLPRTTSQQVGPGVSEQVYLARHGDSGLELRVEVIRYDDFPVLEWTAWLTNTSEELTPLVEDLLALDASFSGTDPFLTHGNGDFNSADGYAMQRSSLEPGTSIELAPRGGRPCDGAFPYLRLAFDGGGLSLAVGWPAQWGARFRGGPDEVAVTCGQERTRLRLLPGETIRTPRMAALAWSGDETRAANQWRRWYRRHVEPRPGGEPLGPQLQVASHGAGEEWTAATEAQQLEAQRRFAAAGIDFDVWWIDAGWYPCGAESGVNDWVVTGTWRADTERFPNGLAPIGEGVAAAGARFLLWFEPERVFPGTDFAETHPEWLLDRPLAEVPSGRWGGQLTSRLFDLGNPDARAHLTELVSGLIEEYGVRFYRQDFNFAPLEFWRHHDADDRQGATENHHVQGYLAFWDGLLERHPGLRIDSCSSGGRRNDLETMRRSVPLHYTDHGYGDHVTKLAFHRTMFEWLPYFRETTLSWDVDEARAAGLEAAPNDSYAFHCALAPMFGVALDFGPPADADEAQVSRAREMIQAWRQIAPLVVNGDFYPATAPSRSGTEWLAWQFHGEGEGFVQAIRHPAADQPDLVVRLQGLDPSATYQLEELESGERRLVRGAELAASGLTFTLPRRRGSLWRYAATSG